MKRISLTVAAAMLWALCISPIAEAQPYQRSAIGAIEAGTQINVRTDESITPKDADGRVFPGHVDENVLNRAGNVVISRGSPVEMMVRQLSDKELTVDLDSVTVNGRRYGIETEENVTTNDRDDGLGANERTGKYVGGGAVIGAIIGAIAGGGKGAAIGAGAGAATGAGVQVLTRGRRVNVPAGSVLTFRLAQPLRAGIADRGYARNGRHYHQNGRYGTDVPYPSSYNTGREKPSYAYNGQYNVQIRRDNNVTWDGPRNARIYVRADNRPEQLFSAGQSGTQYAPWIRQGHRYVFILRDASGDEIASDVLDLR